MAVLCTDLFSSVYKACKANMGILSDAWDGTVVLDKRQGVRGSRGATNPSFSLASLRCHGLVILYLSKSSQSFWWAQIRLDPFIRNAHELLLSAHPDPTRVHHRRRATTKCKMEAYRALRLVELSIRQRCRLSDRYGHWETSIQSFLRVDSRPKSR